MLRIQKDKRKQDKRKGAALVLAALSCLILIPMLGLAVDGANTYMMRNQVTMALNAAVLAGNRSMNLGADIQSQETNAEQVAGQTFYANLPGNVSAPNAQFTARLDPTTHYLTVTGSISASVPLMMMGMIGASSTTFNMNAASSRRAVNIMMVLDHSGPMQGSPLSTLQADASAFVNLFVNNSDNLGLVTFTGAPYVADPLPNLNFQSNVPNDINSMQAPGSGMVNTSAALSEAYQQLVNLGQPGALNVIVLFTNSNPGAFTGDFQGLLQSTSPCNASLSVSGLMTGVLWSNPSQALAEGLSTASASSVAATPDYTAASGCSSLSLRPWNLVTQIPSTDHYGNATNGNTSYAAYTSVNSTYVPLSSTSINAHSSDAVSTSSVPYVITEASINALDYAANRIRSDTNLAPVIFVIGLNGNPGVAGLDDTLMRRVANDKSSPYYNSAQPTGQYFPEQSPDQIQNDFSSIASQVLKLAH